MKLKKKATLAAILLLICILIHVYSSDKGRVEANYSNGFFITFSRTLRYIFGKIPFSVGDILYGAGIGWLIWKSASWFISIFKKNRSGFKEKLAGRLYKFFIISTSIYIIFNIAWGINYNRKGIAWQLGLKIDKYSTEELRQINCLIIDKVNQSKRSLINARIVYPGNKELYRLVEHSYQMVSSRYSFLAYEPRSFKTSMWGWLGNYAAFTGYYNPFTGEAQLNTTVPKFLLPYTACHEVAHQLGYAKEMEANFVGYLAATASKDTLFHYSVYLDLFMYANRNLYYTDSAAAKLYRNDLDTAVVADIKEWVRFNKEHVSFIEPYVKWVYGKYLQGNQQPQGMLSYDEVTGFIISYYKKYGKI
ncbi:MAG TPA: DUF3810 domain-containing protein [Ferruginibacter sp.]|nr:DUF3810 domain-containing protein [Ferruginibacter sp.]